MSLCSSFVIFASHFYISVQSHDGIHPHETLIVKSYEICDNPWITVIQTLLRDNYLYSLYSAFTNHVTITL